MFFAKTYGFFLIDVLSGSREKRFRIPGATYLQGNDMVFA